MNKKLVSSKELSRLLNISLASVNYYVSLGLFKVEDRKGNIRLFDKNEVINIYNTIRRLRKEGYSLRLIQKKLDKGYSI